DPCQNGGHWTGVSCLCPRNLEGARCQFGASTINITAELGPSVMLLTRVTNRNFSEDMRDASSAAYRSFVTEFSQTMDRIYHNVSGYRGTRVLTLTSGSVVVNYKVLLHPPTGDTSLDRQTRDLLEATNTVAQPQNCSHSSEGLCFSTFSSRDTRAEVPALNDAGEPGWLGHRGEWDGDRDSTDRCFSSPELCRKYTPANFSRHYYPHRTQNSLLCVTNCTLNLPGSINCNSG
ncbi:MUC3B protein, partial [Podilymbus podiceps]|nr:MUC3B protein [Podilymbus podiceps]